LRVLKNAGGDVAFEDKLYRKGDKVLDWRQRLVLRLLQKTDTSLTLTLQEYESDIAAGKVPFPSPGYTTDEKVKSIFYLLLRFCADPGSMTVCDTVNPIGFTPCQHDFSLPFHLLSAISATKLDRSSALSEREVEFVLDGFEALLTSENLWEWSVFVALCQIGPGTQPTERIKVQRAKNLILRHFHADDPRSDARRDFLERLLGLPSEWFEEALCYRAAVSNDAQACTSHALGFDAELGNRLLNESLLPRIFFDKKGEERKEVLDSLSTDGDSVADGLAIFLDLEERIKMIATGQEILNEEMLSIIEDNFVFTQSIFETLAKAGDSKTSLLYSPPVNKVRASSMAYECLQRLAQMKILVDSFRLSANAMIEA